MLVALTVFIREHVFTRLLAFDPVAFPEIGRFSWDSCLPDLAGTPPPGRGNGARLGKLEF